jgi:hypothetical protein
MFGLSFIGVIQINLSFSQKSEAVRSVLDILSLEKELMSDPNMLCDNVRFLPIKRLTHSHKTHRWPENRLATTIIDPRSGYPKKLPRIPNLLGNLSLKAASLFGEITQILLKRGYHQRCISVLTILRSFLEILLAKFCQNAPL